MRRFRFAVTCILPFVLVLELLPGCSSPGRKSEVDEKSVKTAKVGDMFEFDIAATNSSDTEKKPYVILISIDGYRFDYNRLFSPPNLLQVAREGVAAESLRPSYPSKTFPNHYTLVTGLYPEHHGIVSNEFFDPARGEGYSLTDRKSSEDGSWYFGEPLWITAQKQGMLTASYFWVGSEADIQGIHPNYYFRYDDKVSYDARVDQAISWLKLSSARRPHFITLYFERVDQAAHKHGVMSAEVKDAVKEIDRAIGRLRAGVAQTGLSVNIVIVSDHGMQDLDPKKVSYLDDLPWAKFVLSKFQVVGRGPQMLLYLNPGENPSLIDEAQKLIKRGAKGYQVYKRDEMEHFHYRATPRVGDLIIVPDAPYSVGLRATPPAITGANHGWDAYRNKNMHGIFYAVGPQVAEKGHLGVVDNIDVYPLVLRLLDLKQRVPIDGSLSPVQSALRPDSGASSRHDSSAH